MTEKKTVWTRKDLVGLKDLSREEINLILDTAKSLQEVSQRPVKKVPALRGKTIANMFFENSTRTRISFELAAKRLSADTVNIGASGSSMSKGETILDMARSSMRSILTMFPQQAIMLFLSRMSLFLEFPENILCQAMKTSMPGLPQTGL